MRRAAKTSVCAAAVGLLLLAAGCGGDDEEGSDEALSRDELIERADAICASGDEEIRAESGSEPQQDFADVKKIVREIVVPGLRDEIDQLRDLTPPPEDQGAYERFVDTLERGVDRLEARPSEVRFGRAYRTIRDARRQADALGMTSCAVGA